jgi:hypothetical protein
MFSHPLKAVMKVGEVTAAGLMKRVRLDPKGQIVPPDPGKAPDQAKAAPSRKIWVAALVFLALVILLTVLAA